MIEKCKRICFLAMFAGMAVILAIQPSFAHDYWIQPDHFQLKVGQATPLRLFVGDHFESQAERPYSASLTVSFRSFTATSSKQLNDGAKNGQKPAGSLTAQKGGGHLVAMERDWSKIEIEPEKFNHYLEHEGLTHILELRRKSGEDKTPGRERYRRYLKALLQVGDKSDTAFKRRVGHRLEIIPQQDPVSLKEGATMTVTVLFDGKPLTNAFIASYNRNAKALHTQQVRTNQKGHATFKMGGPGLWLVRLVHMQRCRESKEFEWESFWAAYSFERPNQ